MLRTPISRSVFAATKDNAKLSNVKHFGESHGSNNYITVDNIHEYILVTLRRGMIELDTG